MIVWFFDIFINESCLFWTQLTFYGFINKQKSQLGPEKTQFLRENVKNFQNHVVCQRFHNETKPSENIPLCESGRAKKGKYEWQI